MISFHDSDIEHISAFASQSFQHPKIAVYSSNFFNFDQLFVEKRYEYRALNVEFSPKEMFKESAYEWSDSKIRVVAAMILFLDV